MKRFFIFCLLLSFGCSEIKKDKEISLEVKDFGKSADAKYPPVPLSPYSYYGCFNFIFDTSGTIYFYQHFYDKNIKPKTVTDFDSDAPIFINLTPDQIVIIPENEITQFIQDNILKADKAYRSIRLVGFTDTIKSKSLSHLMPLLNDPANQVNYLVRKSTYEEQIVLDYKRNQRFYNPAKVNWDSTKVWFDKKSNTGT